MSRRAPPSRAVPAFLLRGFWDALQRRGVSLAKLERMSGVTRARRGDFFSTVAEEDLLRLYEAAAALTGDEALGISLARGLNGPGLHLVGQIFLASATLRQAIELAIRAAPPVGDCFPHFEELPSGQVRIGRLREEGETLGARIYAELKLVFGANPWRCRQPL